MTTHDHYEELVAAYALDALSPEDRREFEQHLSSCVSCQEALSDLHRVSASLGLAAEPVAPPASLRARTIAKATATPRPAVRSKSRDAVPPVVSRPRRAWWEPLAAAASVVCMVGLGLYVLSLRAQLDSTREMLTEALDRVTDLRRDVAEARRDAATLTNTVNVLRSGDLIRVDLRGLGTAPGASGRAYVSLSRGIFFSAERLPGLAADRSYQLWVVPGGDAAVPVSAGVFSVDQAGNSSLSLDLPAGVTTVAALAVTEEPAGGSVRATTKPLLMGNPVNN